MTTSYNHGYEAKKDIKRNDTFDGGGYGIFWDEYHSIEQSHPPSTTTSSATTNASGGGAIPPDSEDGMSSGELFQTVRDRFNLACFRRPLLFIAQ